MHALTNASSYDAPLLRSLTSPDSTLMRLCPREIRKSLNFDRSQLLDFALLLGTDFCSTIFGIGPIRAASFIAKHGSIEALVAELHKTNPRLISETYVNDVKAARAIFNRMPSIPSGVSFEQRSEDKVAVERIMADLETPETEYDDELGTLFSDGESEDETLRYVP